MAVFRFPTAEKYCLFVDDVVIENGKREGEESVSVLYADDRFQEIHGDVAEDGAADDSPVTFPSRHAP